MSTRTVWLASYPKSGNTWLRAIVTALSTHPHLFGVNQLGSGAQPHGVGASLGRFGLDSRWCTTAENDRLRTSLVIGPARPDADVGDDVEVDADQGKERVLPPRLRKTHEVYRRGLPGAEPFPLAATRAALLVVRDPRDVVCSYAPFFGLSIDEAIDALGTERTGGPGSPVNCRTAQPWGSWSSHTRSWLQPDVEFPVHLVRYEDLRVDAAAVLAPVFAAVGLECSASELASAVEQTRFDRLQQSESERGFRETSPRTRTFFRSGQQGGWRNELDDEQVLAIEADHAEVMVELGYELVTDEPARAAHRRAVRGD